MPVSCIAGYHQIGRAVKMATARVIFAVSLALWPVWNSHADFRPYGTTFHGAGAGAGNTGTSWSQDISALSYNPSFAANAIHGGAALSVLGSTRVDNFNAQKAVSASELPLLAVLMPFWSNYSTGLLIHSPFMRGYPDGSYRYYAIEPVLAVSLSRHWNAGFTAGLGVANQSDLYFGYAFSSSVSVSWTGEQFSWGALFRPGASYLLPSPISLSPIQETHPGLFRTGVAWRSKEIILALETEYTDWRNALYIENNVNLVPSMESGFLDYFTLHAGGTFPIAFWKGLLFRSGVLTENYYSADGKNDRQWLITAGLGGYAGSEFWGEKLKIDFSVVSSYLSSFFRKESHQIERVIATFEFRY